MLSTPRCYERECKNYEGVRRLRNDERSEDNVCLAFPQGIPEKIAYGNNLHFVPLKDQGNDIVFQKGERQ